MAGYSATPLVKKLGIKPGARVRFVGAPDGYAALLGPLPEGVQVRQSTRGPLDFIHLFASRRSELERRFAALKGALASDGMLWVSWPKRSSSLPTDLDENLVRRIGLDGGLVDVKVCAVDDDWSGLKFVYRLRDRPAAR
jgi:hypothetical protein